MTENPYESPEAPREAAHVDSPRRSTSALDVFVAVLHGVAALFLLGYLCTADGSTWSRISASVGVCSGVVASILYLGGKLVRGDLGRAPVVVILLLLALLIWGLFDYLR